MELDEVEFPWPSAADDLLARTSESWRVVAALEGSPWSDDLGRYAMGYREGADAILERVATTRGHHADLLVFPALFLYRQFVELQLKHVARYVAASIGEPAPPDNLI